MRLAYQFDSAKKILADLDGEDLEILAGICGRIRQAQETLLEAAADRMTRCTTLCQGLCCRNVQLAAVIGVWDFVYILVLDGALAPKISACLVHEIPFFSADCIFLADRVGPCIFPPDIRPEICITAFCSDDGPIKREIDRVQRSYLKMIWFIRRARLKTRSRRFFGNFRKS